MSRTTRLPVADRLSAVAAAVGLALAACGERAAEEGVRRGGVAVIGGYVDIRTMNPFATITDLNKALERYALYTPLIQLDERLEPQPWLAEAWDTTALGSDSLVLRFRVRRGVRWQDGRATTAHDVAFTFRHARDPRTAYVDAAALALFAPEVEVSDSFTLRFRLRRHPDFLEAFFLLPPLPAHRFGETPPEELARHAFGTEPVGNGPFRFVRRTSQDWVFEANPDFPDALGGPPYLDRVVFRTIPEQTSLITELLVGRVDLAVSVRPPQVPQLERADDVRVVSFPVPNWVFIALNTRLPLFDTRAERRAVAMAIDRRALVDGIMGGLNVTGRSAVTPLHWAYDSTAAVPFAPDSARSLLAAAGWIDRNGDGVRENAGGAPFRFRLKVWHGAGNYRELAEAVQAQLAAVGIDARPEVVEFNTFLAQMQGQRRADGTRTRDFDAAIGNWTDNVLRKDDSQLFHSRYRSSPRQWTGFNSPLLDDLLDSLAITMDRDRARLFWRRYQHALVDESPLIFLFYAQGINGVSSRLAGIPTHDPRGPLGSIRRWRVSGRSRPDSTRS
jgi:peptide/nickel transport system substrate-binding protein